eukprot:637948-Pelagomonas_calceolata.AAC.1
MSGIAFVPPAALEIGPTGEMLRCTRIGDVGIIIIAMTETCFYSFHLAVHSTHTVPGQADTAGSPWS